MAVDGGVNGAADTSANHLLLLTTQTGVIAAITPVNEPMYRRLSTLQSFLTNQLDHACGLNPKSYRAVESEGMGNRGMVDGSLLRRWCELGSQRMAEACAKIGVEEWVVRSDLEFISGAGLSYL
jgi:cleavage and polyadenylation specificity factor subunit 1